MSSPWGEETGEGGRENKSANAKYPKYANGIFHSRFWRGSRLNLEWTTGGGGTNVGRECVKMSATNQRDQTSTIAKSNPEKALAHARDISEPWYRAQALSWVARFINDDPVSVASEAAKAAKECEDNYKKSAVRAWEIAALAERDCAPEAQKRLNEALSLAKTIEPISSRSEAMLLLLQAAFCIDKNAAEKVFGILRASCPIEEHWRCKRAMRDAEKMISGELRPRPFFW